MKKDQETGYLAVLRVNRAQAVQLLGAAVVLGTGVNLVASYLSERLSGPVSAGVGIALIFVAFVLLSNRALWPRQRTRTFQGFFIYDNQTNSLANADPRYHLGASLDRYLRAAFAENRAIKSIWDRNPLSSLRPPYEKEGDPDKSLDLVRQGAEYFVLRDFSTSLSDYFKTGDYEDDELETLSHTDIPDVLLQNKFMKIFAEPMEERSAFLGAGGPSLTGSNIISANTSEGALYERFQLLLPRGWKVTRSGSDLIEIRTPRFTLTILVNCRGLDAELPLSYLGHFFGGSLGSDSSRYSAFSVDVQIRITPRRAWLVTPRRWKYYRWIDEWMGRVETSISKDAYLDRIGWEAAETCSQLLQPAQSRVSDSDVPAPLADQNRSEEANSKFRVGDRVDHSTFGLGEVVGREGGGIALVSFDDDAERDSPRKLMWDFAPIRIIDRGRPLD